MKFIQLAIETVISEYNGKIPLSHFLKSFFKERPKLGSRDRKAIAEAAYIYYRLARFFENAPYNVWKILNWATKNNLTQQATLLKTIALINFDDEDVLPCFKTDLNNIELSSILNHDDWYQSLLTLPNTFIRIKKEHLGLISAQLKKDSIPFTVINEHSISIPNGYNISNSLDENKFVIQDLSSQQSLNLFKNLSKFKAQNAFKVWDTCSGAGGKMLLLKANFPNASVWSTDIRASILHNLKMRSKRYNQTLISTAIVDSSQSKQVESIKEQFDLVMSDVPCSGSGTWARTPEQFFFFENKKIAEFSSLQTKIANNVIKKVKPNGYFLYITCSVFKAENETVVEQILKSNPSATLLQQELINGIEKHADCMFTALFRIN